MMEKVIEHPSGVRVTIELPDGVPEAVFETLAVDIDIVSETQEDAVATLEAFGGLAVWEPLDRYSSSGEAKTVYLKGAGLVSRPLEFGLRIPTGRDVPVDETPFLTDLLAKQKAAVEADAAGAS
jgi:hypothetical protein